MAVGQARHRQTPNDRDVSVCLVCPHFELGGVQLSATARKPNTVLLIDFLGTTRPALAFGDGHAGSSEAIAMSGLTGLAAAALTGALWDTPIVTASFRWFVS
jgi:hypothetical protein